MTVDFPKICPFQEYVSRERLSLYKIPCVIYAFTFVDRALATSYSSGLPQTKP